MHLHARPATALALLAALGMLVASGPLSAQVDGVRALEGDWIYVEDRT